MATYTDLRAMAVIIAARKVEAALKKLEVALSNIEPSEYTQEGADFFDSISHMHRELDLNFSYFRSRIAEAEEKIREPRIEIHALRPGLEVAGTIND